jgi:acetyltransferase-like isoleucine patch superfamily enzyme
MNTEMIRRGLQTLVSGKWFDAPGLLALRMKCYRLFFRIGANTIFARNVLFIRPHGLDQGFVEVGKDVEIGHDTEIEYSGGIIIEDDVWISQHVLIDTHKHLVKTRQLKKEQGVRMNTVRICSDAWIGAFAVILPGVLRIGQGSVVGAGSVVTRDVPDYAVVAGVPAVIIGERKDESGRDQITDVEESPDLGVSL